MTFTYETPQGRKDGLTAFQVVDLLWRNHPDCFLNNGAETFSVWDAREALTENIILDVCPTANQRIKNVRATVTKQA